MDLLDQEQLRDDTMTPASRDAHDRIYGINRDALQGTGPSVVSINGVVALLAVTEFTVWRTGLRKPNGLLTYRADQAGVRSSRDAVRHERGHQGHEVSGARRIAARSRRRLRGCDRLQQDHWGAPRRWAAESARLTRSKDPPPDEAGGLRS